MGLNESVSSQRSFNLVREDFKYVRKATMPNIGTV